MKWSEIAWRPCFCMLCVGLVQKRTAWPCAVFDLVNPNTKFLPSRCCVAVWNCRTFEVGVCRAIYNDYVCNWLWGLFMPWTMKSSRGPVKAVNSCWARPWTTSTKVLRVVMEFEVSERLVRRSTLSTDMVQRMIWGEAKEVVENGKGLW